MTVAGESAPLRRAKGIVTFGSIPTLVTCRRYVATWPNSDSLKAKRLDERGNGQPSFPGQSGTGGSGWSLEAPTEASRAA
jgi:hypothetical protein